MEFRENRIPLSAPCWYLNIECLYVLPVYICDGLIKTMLLFNEEKRLIIKLNKHLFHKTIFFYVYRLQTVDSRFYNACDLCIIYKYK